MSYNSKSFVVPANSYVVYNFTVTYNDVQYLPYNFTFYGEVTKSGVYALDQTFDANFSVSFSPNAVYYETAASGIIGANVSGYANLTSKIINVTAPSGSLLSSYYGI